MFFIVVLCFSFGIIIVYFLVKFFGVDKKLVILVVCGIGICGVVVVVVIFL